MLEMGVLEATDLITVAAIVAGFTGVVLFFRLQRELELRERGIRSWIPWADRLIMASSASCILIAILPLLVFGKNNTIVRALSASACAGSLLLVTGYVPAILAHYRLLFGKKRLGPTDNPEPAEAIIVWITVLLSVAVSIATLIINLRKVPM